MGDLMTFAAEAARLLQETATCCAQYYWMTVAACIFGFLMACGIGANDVANAFATSVAAKSVTLKMAVVIASICEFLGAMLLGASVTSTIRSKIVDPKLYADDPQDLMYGMLCSLVSASFILFVANYFALPVSTTHTIVGSIVGFSIAAKGFQSVNWMEVGKIFISWVASPLVTGIAAVIFFSLVKKFVLKSNDPYQRAVRLYPFIVFAAIGLDAFMVLYKAGNNNDQIKKWGIKFQVPVGFGIGLVLAFVFHFCLSPRLQRRINAKMEAQEKAMSKTEKENEDAAQDMAENGEEEKSAAMKRVLGEEDETEVPATAEATMSSSERQKKGLSASFHKSMSKLGEITINRDIEAEALKHSKTKEIWDAAEQFNPQAEEMFSYLQVLTACLLSFAHGANDVANAIGPIAAVFLIYNTAEASSKAPVPKWIIFLGAIGIVIGLVFYGYKLMISLGYKITHMSPSRGFCIELAASFVVVIASFLGIPISTTQCQVGGTIGVGLVGGSKNVNAWYIFKVVFGWVATFFAVCIINAGVFSFAYYAPSAAGFE